MKFGSGFWITISFIVLVALSFLVHLVVNPSHDGQYHVQVQKIGYGRIDFVIDQREVCDLDCSKMDLWITANKHYYIDGLNYNFQCLTNNCVGDLTNDTIIQVRME